MSDSIYDIAVKHIDGTQATLDAYKGQTMLIVNTASKCGYTPQFEGLETLYKKYRDQGLVVLGFPCNQFLSQDPGDEKEIAQFCSLNYDVTFPMFAKVEVNGGNEHPLFRFLKSKARGFLGTKAIKWNFTKFLVDKNGNVLKRWGSKDTPAAIESTIKATL
jgi:glutathione peroxidase